MPVWSVGTRRSHAGVVSVNYLYWVSSEPCAKGSISNTRGFCSALQCVLIDFVCIISNLHNSFFHFKDSFVTQDLYFSMLRPVEELVALFPAIRNQLVCWALTKPSGFLFTLLPVQQMEHSLVQRNNRRYLIGIWKIDSICIFPQKCAPSISFWYARCILTHTSFRDEHIKFSHSSLTWIESLILLLAIVENSFGLSSCSCKQLIILIEVQNRNPYYSYMPVLLLLVRNKERDMFVHTSIVENNLKEW